MLKYILPLSLLLATFSSAQDPGIIQLLDKIQQLENRIKVLETREGSNPVPTRPNEQLVVGKAAPSAWQIEKWFQGEGEITLDNTKPTLVVFWEVWCPHCRNEVPKIESLYNEFKEKGLQVLGLTKLTRGVTETELLDFVKQSNLTYPIAKETGGLSTYFMVSGVPAAAVVKGDKIVWRGHPATLSKAQLEGLLG